MVKKAKTTKSSTNITRAPNGVDVHVGQRMRLRRIMLGISQENLSDKLAVTFQQVQKYERGVNRVSASRLYEISKILSVPVQYFFEDIEDGNRKRDPFSVNESKTTADFMGFLDSSEGGQLNRAFLKITNPKVRKEVIRLLRSLSDSPASKQKSK